ncbi:MAG: hypothetical protein II376_07645 [Clostridia bacterium]|nr:hypothetical protein [Clostridia bacterium]
MNNTTPWWHKCSAVLRYMPGEDGKSINDIINELDGIADFGFKAIHITAPYRSAGFYPWWGLRPLDHFAVNDILGGSMDDFSRLVEECHMRGIRVVVFLNLGYDDVDSIIWKAACLAQGCILIMPKNDYFLWSRSPCAPPPFPANECFLQSGHWHRSREAGQYYWCYWERDGIAEPQYNWQDAGFQNYALTVLRHWLATGIDGIIVDAVNWYAGCTKPLIRSLVTDTIHEYANVMCIPEGATGFGDPFMPWLTECGFDIIEDQPFHSDEHWNGSAIIRAIDSSSPYIIDSALEQCRKVRDTGAISWSYLSWGSSWTSEKRLLEIAMLIGTGHMTDIIPSYLSDFDSVQKEKFRKLIKVSHHQAIWPSKERLRVYPTYAASCYCCLCSPGEDQPVLCIFNLSDKITDVSITLTELPAFKNNRFRDLISGEAVYSFDGCIEATLEPFGFAFITAE